MSKRVGLVWDPKSLSYDFGPQHPLKPVRVELTVELSRSLGLLSHPGLERRSARDATREELRLVHSAVYIEAVERISQEAHDPFTSYGWGIGSGDNPAFRGMHEASAHIAGGSIVAAEMLRSGDVEHAFHPAGGLHHAMADSASGFCIYNDPAIAIQWLLDGGVERVAYVDVDVHHGDGVQAAFYNDPRVLTISLHESGAYLFPGTGFPNELGGGDAEGTSVNVALPPSTDHDSYRGAFDAVVPPLVEAFRPAVLVTQLGCDTHVTDPLAHLALETRTYRYLAESLHALAHSTTQGKWLATGGGGYQIFSVVPRAWTLYFAEMLGAAPDGKLPQEWIDLAKSRGAGTLPDRLIDPAIALPAEQGRRARAATQAACEETLRLIRPYYSR
ncbi:MAG: acetoin utilization protein AcuC [Actinomycetota bacterium]|nr:acetoin utilization protein AcuC [Actinomycetota bacterium]